MKVASVCPQVQHLILGKRPDYQKMVMFFNFNAVEIYVNSCLLMIVCAKIRVLFQNIYSVLPV